jgi:hypothetical protein
MLRRGRPDQMLGGAQNQPQVLSRDLANEAQE